MNTHTSTCEHAQNIAQTRRQLFTCVWTCVLVCLSEVCTQTLKHPVLPHSFEQWKHRLLTWCRFTQSRLLFGLCGGEGLWCTLMHTHARMHAHAFKEHTFLCVAPLPSFRPAGSLVKHQPLLFCHVTPDPCGVCSQILSADTTEPPSILGGLSLCLVLWLPLLEQGLGGDLQLPGSAQNKVCLYVPWTGTTTGRSDYERMKV